MGVFFNLTVPLKQREINLNRMKTFVAFLGAVVLLQCLTGGDASECCRPKPGWSQGQVTLNCNDCKPGTPYCGVGRCNLWGCNCDGGCRQGTCGGFFSAPQIKEMIDTNHDGKISVTEAKDYLQMSGIHFEDQETHTHLTAMAGPAGFLPDDIITGDDHKYDRCEPHPFFNVH